MGEEGLMWCSQVKNTLRYVDVCYNKNRGQKCSLWLNMPVFTRFRFMTVQCGSIPGMWPNNAWCQVVAWYLFSPFAIMLSFAPGQQVPSVSKRIYLFIFAPSLRVIPPVSSCSICSHNVGARAVHQRWLAPSGNKAVKIMATERRGQSIRAGARSVGRSGFSATFDAESRELCFSVSSDRWGGKTACVTRGLKVNEFTLIKRKIIDWLKVFRASSSFQVAA